MVVSGEEVQKGGIVEGGSDRVGGPAVHEIAPGMGTGQVDDVPVRPGKIAWVDGACP